MQQVRITHAVAVVLARFLDEPGARRYGYELMKVTGFASGKLYPVLARLENAGWLDSEFEVIDQKAERRPPRRWYRLTGEAVTVAGTALTRFGRETSPTPTTAGQLGLAGGGI